MSGGDAAGVTEHQALGWTDFDKLQAAVEKEGESDHNGKAGWVEKSRTMIIGVVGGEKVSECFDHMKIDTKMDVGCLAKSLWQGLSSSSTSEKGGFGVEEIKPGQQKPGDD